MERVRFLTHKGKQVLLIDYRDLTDEAEMLAMIEERKAIVAEQPPKSLLTIVEVTGARFGKNAITKIKEANVHDLPYVRRAALVGVDETQKPAVEAVSMFSQRQWGMFATLSEALDWIVSEEETHGARAS